MLGRVFLATCIFDEGAEAVSVYLPKGYDWYLGSEKFSGGQTVEMNIKTTDEMPFFIRGGSVIPLTRANALTALRKIFTLIFILLSAADLRLNTSAMAAKALITLTATALS